MRFGEGLANPYGDGEVTVWYHPVCAAYRRPEPLLQALASQEEAFEDAALLRRIAEHSLAHRRLCRIGGVERATSGRARCRSCRELIGRDTLRIPLLFHEEGMYNASGFVHLSCAPVYFQTGDLLDCIRHFTPALEGDDLLEVEKALG